MPDSNYLKTNLGPKKPFLRMHLAKASSYNKASFRIELLIMMHKLKELADICKAPTMQHF